MFLLTLLVLVVCVDLEQRGIVDSYYRTTGAVGSIFVAVTLFYLTFVALTREYATLYPSVLITTVALASALSYGLYRLFESYRPALNDGTGYIGLLVIWATPSTASRTSCWLTGLTRSTSR